MPIRLDRRSAEELAQVIQADWDSAKAAHEKRIERNVRYMDAFLAKLNENANPDECQYRVPLTQAQVLNRVARDVASFFGGDAQIAAEPVGESDIRSAKRAAAFAHWNFFNHMRPIHDVALVALRRWLFGRSHVFAPWEVRRNAAGKVTWRGPGFYPLDPDNFIHPPQRDAKTLHDFEWVIRRYWESGRSLRATRKQMYPLLTEADLADMTERSQHDHDGYDVQEEQDEGEGVNYDTPIISSPSKRARRGFFEFWEWYGWWDDKPVVCRVCRSGPAKVASIELLTERYRDMPVVRPFLEAALPSYGSYWPMGLGQMLEAAEKHLTANFRQFHEAGALAANPPILTDADTVDTFSSQPIESGRLYAVRNPGASQPLKVDYDPNFFVLTEQFVRADAERSSRQTDYNTGRDINRPTAPKTARGLELLVSEGALSSSLEDTLLGEDIAQWLKYFHALWQTQTSDEEHVTFRVTEQDAKLFKTSNGKALMFETEEERFGEFDFRLKFSKTTVEKEAAAQKVMTAYQLLVQNPLFLQAPRALWAITVKLLKAMDLADIAQEMPEPPDTGSRNPDREHSMMLQGEIVEVRDGDVDEIHLDAHYRMLGQMHAAETPDQNAIEQLTQHISKHEQQKRMKLQMQALMQGVIGELTNNDQLSGGLTMQPQALPIEQVLGGAVGNQMSQKPQ